MGQQPLSLSICDAPVSGELVMYAVKQEMGCKKPSVVWKEVIDVEYPPMKRVFDYRPHTNPEQQL